MQIYCALFRAVLAFTRSNVKLDVDILKIVLTKSLIVERWELVELSVSETGLDSVEWVGLGSR